MNHQALVLAIKSRRHHGHGVHPSHPAHTAGAFTLYGTDVPGAVATVPLLGSVTKSDLALIGLCALAGGVISKRHHWTGAAIGGALGLAVPLVSAKLKGAGA